MTLMVIRPRLLKVNLAKARPYSVTIDSINDMSIDIPIILTSYLVFLKC